MEPITIAVIIALLATLVLCYLAFVFNETGSENAPFALLVGGVLVAVEVVYLLVRFAKYVWYL
jgi:hypothetical protein